MANLGGGKELPVDLLGHIAGKLTIPDYIRCGAISPPWASIVKLSRPNPNQTPWLMVAGQPDDKETTATFIDLSNNKSYKIQLPDPPIRSRLWMGSSDGWLVTVDDRSEMILLNPLTASQIPLPPISTMSILTVSRDPDGNISTYKVKAGCYDREEFRMYLYGKVVLSTNPSKDQDFKVMMIHSTCRGLAFSRAGDTAWTVTPLAQKYYNFDDVIYHNQKFHTVTKDGIVHAWDHDNKDGIFSKPSLVIPGPDVVIDKAHDYTLHNFRKYLMVPPWGGFLQVWRRQDHDEEDCYYRTEEVRVYQFDEQDHRWTALRSLGDHALFVGSNRSMCISSRDVPGVRRNCIYFTEDFLEMCRFCREQSRDVGIFNLEDGSFELFFTSDASQLNWPPPIWITPCPF